MTKANKLPQPKAETISQFLSPVIKNKSADTDTTSVTTSGITSTHIFNK